MRRSAPVRRPNLAGEQKPGRRAGGPEHQASAAMLAQSEGLRYTRDCRKRRYIGNKWLANQSLIGMRS